jgi:hypothetical protein
MKLIEAMKEIKNLKVKAEDLRKKVACFCVKASFESNMYPDQGAQIQEWIQSHSDTIKLIAKLSVGIQKTNLATIVDIELGGKEVSHSISEWILRRRDLAELERACWAGMTDKGIKEGMFKQTDGTSSEVKIVRYYDPKIRDEKIELYRSEPSIIDRTLETVNAITDLVE